jgi:hypothetical protein
MVGGMSDRRSSRRIRLDDLIDLREREKYNEDEITKVIRIRAIECSCCAPSRAGRA